MAKSYDYSSGSSSGKAGSGDVNVPADPNSGAKPSRAPQSPSDIVDTYRGDGSSRDAKTLRDALNQPSGVQTITKGKR